MLAHNPSCYSGFVIPNPELDFKIHFIYRSPLQMTNSFELQWLVSSNNSLAPPE